MASVSLNQVHKVYANGVEAVRGVDLEIADGEFMVLVGPSGCGKSTLLRMIAGLESVSAGSIDIGGTDVTRVDARDRDIAMVFQSYALYPHMTVRDNLAFGLKRRKTPKPAIAERIDEAARTLGLEELLDRSPDQLSGGQRQRVAIGRAMVREPAVYLMDEPLSNLDAKLRVSMRSELARLHARLGVTTVYVTHDQTEAMTLGDRVCVLRDGAVEQIGSPAELYSAPRTAFVAGFIGSPSMNFATATIAGDTVVVGSVRLPLPPALAGAAEGRTEVVVGLRPQDFALRPVDFADDLAAHDESLVAKLSVMPEIVEELGAQQLVVFGVDAPASAIDEGGTAQDERLLADSRSATFTAVVGTRRPVDRDRELVLYFDARQLYLFDPQTAAAIGVPGDGRELDRALSTVDHGS